MTRRRKQASLSRTARLWYDRRAACRASGVPVADFYPPGSSDAPPHVLALCAGCPVRSACLEAALAEEGGARARYGIRGGLTPDERAALHFRRVRVRQNEERKAERAARKNQEQAA